MLPTDHLSHSQVSMFVRCEKQFYYRYVKDLKTPTGAMLALGSSYHAAHEHNFEQKIESQKDLKCKEVEEKFADSFDFRKANEEIDWRGSKGAIIKPGELKDAGVLMAATYHLTTSPSVQPIGVEVPFEVKFGNRDWKFIGRVDVITDGYIIDLKTAKSRKPEADVHKDLQGTAYALANKYALKDMGDTWRQFRLDVCVKTKTPKIQQVTSDRTQEDIDWYLKWIGKVAQRMEQACESGVFLEKIDGWHCSPQYCGYFDKCKPYREVIISTPKGGK